MRSWSDTDIHPNNLPNSDGNFSLRHAQIYHPTSLLLPVSHEDSRIRFKSIDIADR